MTELPDPLDELKAALQRVREEVDRGLELVEKMAGREQEPDT